MAARACVLAVAAAVCLASLSGANAQGPKPVLGSPTFPAGNFTFDYVYPPKDQNVTLRNNATAFTTSGLASNMFVVKPCTLGTIPHFHPNAYEYWIGATGKFKVYVFNGESLIVSTLESNKRGIKTHVAPPNHLHFFLNDECEQAAIFSIIRTVNASAGAGFFGYNPVPKAVTDVKATAQDLITLINGQNSNGTNTLLPLTNNCKKRCARKYRYRFEDDDDDHKKGYGKRLF